MIRIVAIGGGTGLSAVLRGLRHQGALLMGESGPPRLSITAIVGVSDNGGSSGRLRSEFGIPAVGDLRKCLISLAETRRPLADLFDHRFASKSGVNGHSLGNLILLALIQRHGSLSDAVQRAAQILELDGSVLPSTNAYTTLCAEYENGSYLCGESQIAAARGRIKDIQLVGEDPIPAPGVLDAIQNADVVVLGPGSLFTSIITNLLVRGVAKSIAASRSTKIYVTNLRTQPGETEGFSAAEHLHRIRRYLGRGAVQYCLLNTKQPSPSVDKKYRDGGSMPVLQKPHEIAGMGVSPICADLLTEAGGTIRHDPVKLGEAILSIMARASRSGEKAGASNNKVA
jgi:uncharacterized cofD-like protein